MYPWKGWQRVWRLFYPNIGLDAVSFALSNGYFWYGGYQAIEKMLATQKAQFEKRLTFSGGGGGKIGNTSDYWFQKQILANHG